MRGIFQENYVANFQKAKKRRYYKLLMIFTTVKRKTYKELLAMEKQRLPDILTAQHIATYLGISRRRVYELFQISEDVGGIKYFQIGLSKRVDKEDFFQWIEQKKNDR